MAKAHPGFAAVQARISKNLKVPPDRAAAILASATRHASASAKAKNPKLKKVKGY